MQWVVHLLDNGRMGLLVDLESWQIQIQINNILEWFCKGNVMDMELINK